MSQENLQSYPQARDPGYRPSTDPLVALSLALFSVLGGAVAFGLFWMFVRYPRTRTRLLAERTRALATELGFEVLEPDRIAGVVGGLRSEIVWHVPAYFMQRGHPQTLLECWFEAPFALPFGLSMDQWPGIGSTPGQVRISGPSLAAEALARRLAPGLASFHPTGIPRCLSVEVDSQRVRVRLDDSCFARETLAGALARCSEIAAALRRLPA